jgi:hypothetical protein
LGGGRGSPRPIGPPGDLARLLADYEPSPAPLEPLFRAFVDRLVALSTAWIRLAHGPRPRINRIAIQFFNRARSPWYTKPLINRASAAS